MKEKSKNLSINTALRLPSLELAADFHVAAGETVALVGPSGAGKTTLLRLIAGLYRPDRGVISLGSRVLWSVERGIDLPPEARRVAYVFQEPALFPHLSVAANVAYSARMAGLSRRDAARQAMGWLERFGAEALGNRRIPSLSGGQKQRVALARAMASQPEALLLDEPFSALDVNTRAEVRQAFSAALADTPVPTLLVTHDPLDARFLSDRVIVLEAGQVTQEGTAEALTAHPRGAFVAHWAGMNLYHIRVGGGEGLQECVADGALFHALPGVVRGEAYLSFAPEEVTLSDAPMSGSAQNQWPGRVVEFASLGDRLRVTVDIGVRVRADITHEAAGRLPLAPGGSVWLAVKATAIRVYP